MATNYLDTHTTLMNTINTLITSTGTFNTVSFRDDVPAAFGGPLPACIVKTLQINPKAGASGYIGYECEIAIIVMKNYTNSVYQDINTLLKSVMNIIDSSASFYTTPKIEKHNWGSVRYSTRDIDPSYGGICLGQIILNVQWTDYNA